MKKCMLFLLQALLIGLLAGFVFYSRPAEAYSIKLSKAEKALMADAYKEGKRIGKPEILQAILLNETVAGRFGRVGDVDKDWRKQSYGVMQIQFNTARRLAPKDMSDQELLIYVASDDKFNIRLARVLVEQLWRRYKDWDRVLLAYNVGPWNVDRYGLKYDPNGYLAKAYFHLTSTIKEFNLPFKHAEMLERMTVVDVRKIKSIKVTYKSWRDYSRGWIPGMYHTVVKGDTLSKLAKKYLGNWRRWTDIQKLNPAVIPSNMKIGSTLRIK
jgi:hypothetical protein